MFFAQVNPDHPGQDARWTRRASGASQARAPPSRMRHAKPSHKFGFTLPLMEEQRLFHTIRWSDQQARTALAVKINRQPCPSLSGQQLLPQPGSEVTPILPSGPHEAQSLMHIIREQPSQKFFSTEIFLYLLSLSNFLWYLPSGHSLPAHPSRTPPGPRGFQGVFFFFLFHFEWGFLGTNSDAQTAEKSGQENTTRLRRQSYFYCWLCGSLRAHYVHLPHQGKKKKNI